MYNLESTPRIEKKPSSLRYYQDGPPSYIDLEKWRLNLTNMRSNSGRYEKSICYRDVMAMPQITESRRMVCVCNWSIRRPWTGVLLQDLLEVTNTPYQSDAILQQSSVGTDDKGIYQSCIRLGDALQRRAMLIHSVDGAPLPLEQGYPVRLIDFGLYGYKGVKCLSRIDITDKMTFGHWEQAAGYDLEGRIKPKKYWCVDIGQHRFIDGGGEVTDF